MKAATLHAFLRRLERHRVLSMDLRAIMAIEVLLAEVESDAEAGHPWAKVDLAIALASILAHDEAQWSAVNVRLLDFFAGYSTNDGARVPEDLRPQANDCGSEVASFDCLRIASPAPARNWSHTRDRMHAEFAVLVRRFTRLPDPLRGSLLVILSVSVALGTIVTLILVARWLTTPSMSTGAIPRSLEVPSSAPATGRASKLAESRIDSDPGPMSEPVPAPAPFGRTPVPLRERDPRGHSEATPTPYPEATPGPLPRSLLSVLPPDATTRRAIIVGLGLVSALLAMVGIRWIGARRGYLVEREEKRQEALKLRRERAGDNEDEILTYAVERVPPLPLAAIDDAAVLLGRLVEFGRGDELDVAATVDATLYAAGRFDPVQLPRRSPRALIVLVDLEKGGHPALDALLYVLARWSRLGVQIERYDFSLRPRFVSPRHVDADPDLHDDTGPRLTLAELGRRKENAPLLLATRLAVLSQRSGDAPWLRQLVAWPTRVLLDLDPRPLVERREAAVLATRLRRAGMPRFPFTAEGLAALASNLVYGTSVAVSDPTLLPWRSIEPALSRWAALAGCVPDPTWVQLEAFRRGFDELRDALPNPGYAQRMVEWLQDLGEDGTSGDGRRLALSDDRIATLLSRLRIDEGVSAGETTRSEKKARAMIIQQLASGASSSQLPSQRRAMRLAFHRAVLEPVRADELLAPFLSTPEEREMIQMLRTHRRNLVKEESSATWRILEARQSDAIKGPVPLRSLVVPSLRHDFLPQAFVATLLSLSWIDIALASEPDILVLAGLASLGFAGVTLEHLRRVGSLRQHSGPRPLLSESPRFGNSEDRATGQVLKLGPVALRDCTPMPLLDLSGGEFTMGSDDSKDERPRHRVVLDPFSVAVYPVTQEQWYSVMGGEAPGRTEADLPKTDLSWFDAICFLNELSLREGLEPCYEAKEQEVHWHPERDGYRLPTEAEWEYAARAATITAYSFGNDQGLLGDYGWYSRNADEPQPVGGKRPNPWGIHDIHGNVREWVWDQYGAYEDRPVRNPAGPDKTGPVSTLDTGGALGRVLRGGSFIDWPELLRSPSRSRSGPTYRSRFWGLRVARGPRSRDTISYPL